jgi:NDP-sugar pyrophosphorylase family protein
MNAIILCGGLSTRLGETTKSIPKILLPIGDKTVLDWQLEKLTAAGVDRVVLAAGHLADVLRRDVGDTRGGIDIIYAIEPERLGTGGAIKHALGSVAHPDAPSIILNGDVLTTAAVPDMLAALNHASDGLILGSRVPDASAYGTLEYDGTGHLKAFREKEGVAKPGYINGGFYIFTPAAHKYFPEQRAFSVEYDVFPKMKNLFVYESDHPWVDIGVPERLAWAREHWKTFL